ncbi:MAG: hypothetical protein CBARDMAM_5046 [uncultured Caballeronia sp.]|nr:MAG: hypothetical protein CBARDMAM_5046 [uncultured Caballeronia sp.]
MSRVICTPRQNNESRKLHSLATEPPHNYSYFRKALAGHRLPAAFIDLNRIETNLEHLRARAEGMPIRLVTKSV